MYSKKSSYIQLQYEYFSFLLVNDYEKNGVFFSTFTRITLHNAGKENKLLPGTYVHLQLSNLLKISKV